MTQSKADPRLERATGTVIEKFEQFDCYPDTYETAKTIDDYYVNFDVTVDEATEITQERFQQRFKITDAQHKTGVTPDEQLIDELDKPNEATTIIGKVTDRWEEHTIDHAGHIEDESGAIKFRCQADTDTKLEPGNTYKIANATTTKYGDRIELLVTHATHIEEMSGESTSDTDSRDVTLHKFAGDDK